MLSRVATKSPNQERQVVRRLKGGRRCIGCSRQVELPEIQLDTGMVYKIKAFGKTLVAMLESIFDFLRYCGMKVHKLMRLPKGCTEEAVSG